LYGYSLVEKSFGTKIYESPPVVVGLNICFKHWKYCFWCCARNIILMHHCTFWSPPFCSASVSSSFRCLSHKSLAFFSISQSSRCAAFSSFFTVWILRLLKSGIPSDSAHQMNSSLGSRQFGFSESYFPNDFFATSAPNLGDHAVILKCRVLSLGFVDCWCYWKFVYVSWNMLVIFYFPSIGKLVPFA
jgi:hypothetical protein